MKSCLLLVFTALASAQIGPVGPGPITATSTAPSGSCSVNQGRLVGPGGVIYTCQNGTWAKSAQAATIPGTSITLTSGAAQFAVCTSTCTVTVPAPAPGAQYCVYNDDNVSTVITLAAIGSSASYENQARTAYGTAGTGTLISGGAVGDQVCIVYRDATHYTTLATVGTWTAN